MKTSTLITTLAVAAAGVNAAIGSTCKDSKGNVGTCQKTSWCNSRKGTYKSDLCPKDPENVKCCFEPNCWENGIGHCQLDSLDCFPFGRYKTSVKPLSFLLSSSSLPLASLGSFC